MNTHLPSKPSSSHSGIISAILAYATWGLLPIYWKLLGTVPAIEIVCHRMLWSTVFLAVLLLLQKRGREFVKVARTPQHLSVLVVTAALLTFNWGLYIYGVNTERVVETSLGYFINPLVSVLLGLVFLQERLNWGQILAVILAIIGVTNFVWHLGVVPWIALALAFSFGLYGLLRKIVPIAPMVGLAMETLLITPIALILVSHWARTGVGHLGSTLGITLLLMGAGVATSMPLLWFNTAAKQLRLSTLGFLQYVAPSLQLLLGVFLYQEPFTQIHLITFGCIWLALLIYSTTSLQRQK